MTGMSPQFYKELCQQVVSYASECGATSSETHLGIDEGFSVNVRMGQVESLEYHLEQAMSVSVYINQKSGSASTTDLSDAAIKRTIEKACSFARFTEDDPFTGLADKSLMATEILDLDLYHPWELDPKQAIELAKNCEQMGLDYDQRITNSEGSSVNTNKAYRVYANSHGFIGDYHSTSHSMNSVFIAKENGAMQRDYDYTVARNANDLDDIAELARRAASKTIARLGPHKIATAKMPVIFNHDLAVGLLGNLFRAISGSNLYRKSSFLLDHLDKAIFPEWMQITMRPHIVGGMASKSFDSEGVATQDRDFIQDGVLKSYLLGSYSARKLGMQSTGTAGGIQNMLVDNSGINFDQLLQKMGTGLLVTELIGQGVNIVTGDFSRGAFGYWVENGKIQYPVDGITIAGNLKDMFADIVAISDDTEKRTSIQTGSILIKEMMVAGSS